MKSLPEIVEMYDWIATTQHQDEQKLSASKLSKRERREIEKRITTMGAEAQVLEWILN